MRIDSGIRAFYSDPHFGHRQIIQYCERPFDDVDQQTRELIHNYNYRVAPGDWVCWVGDCFLSLNLESVQQIMTLLNGFKILVIGNHDRSKSWMCRAGFTVVVDELRMHIAGRSVLVCHYPYAHTKRRGGIVDQRYPERRPKRHKGEVLIHGHTHDSRRRNGNQIHVGVDAWDYGPAPFDEVAALIAEV